MSRQPALDPIDKPTAELVKVLEQLRDQALRYRGIRGQKINPLSSTATLTDCINKINEVIDLLQG